MFLILEAAVRLPFARDGSNGSGTTQWWVQDLVEGVATLKGAPFPGSREMFSLKFIENLAFARDTSRFVTVIVIGHPPKTMKLMTLNLVRFYCGRCTNRQH